MNPRPRPIRPAYLTFGWRYPQRRLTPEEQAYREARHRAGKGPRPKRPGDKRRGVRAWIIRRSKLPTGGHPRFRDYGQQVLHQFPVGVDPRSEETQAILVRHGLPADELARRIAKPRRRK